MSVIAFFLSPLGRWVGGALLVAALLGGIYAKGYSDGKANVQAKWDAAELAAVENARKARTDAERSVTDDGLPNDPDRRD